MKRSILVFLMTLFLLLGGFNVATGQEQPKPKKDSVNMDTDAKPSFYYPVEDDKAKGSSGKSSAATIAIIVGAVVVVGAAGFFLLKKKK
jgi:LPXTG-motif cell wall-anchored protein